MVYIWRMLVLCTLENKSDYIIFVRVNRMWTMLSEFFTRATDNDDMTNNTIIKYLLYVSFRSVCFWWVFSCRKTDFTIFFKQILLSFLLNLYLFRWRCSEERKGLSHIDFKVDLCFAHRASKSIQRKDEIPLNFWNFWTLS